MQWLVASVLLSVVLTVILNVAVRVMPNLGDRIGRGLARLESRGFDSGRGGEHRVRVFAPWKTMIVASVALTILFTVGRWIF